MTDALDEVRLRALIQALNAAVVVEDAERRLLLANQDFCDLFSIPAPPEVLVGADCAEAAAQSKGLFADPEGFLSGVERALAGRERVLREELEFADGRALSRDYVPIWVADEYLGHLWVYRDVTPQREAVRAIGSALDSAEAASRAKGEFLSHMTHELRTPLNAIMGVTELLADTTLAPEQSELLETVRSSAEILLYLVNDVLDFSRVESGQMQLELEPFTPRRLASDVVNFLRHQAAAKGLELDLELKGPTETPLLGDAPRLRQVLLNLVGNGIKYTQAGRVALCVEVLPDHSGAAELRIAVTDTGLGIPEDVLERIFERFYRVPEARTRRVPGTGLGLAITEQLVELMGGAIQVESTLGQGSRFTVQVPLAVVTVDAREKAGAVAVLGADATSLAGRLSRAGVDARAVEDESALLALLLEGSTPAALLVRAPYEGGSASRMGGLVRSLTSEEPCRIVGFGEPGAEEGMVDSWLPAAASIDEILGALGRAEPVEASALTRPARVLFVGPDAARLSALKDAGHRAERVEGADAAVRAVDQDAFDAVVVDLTRGESAGLAVAVALRGAEARTGGARTPLIGLVESVDPSNQRRLENAGLDRVLSASGGSFELDAALRDVAQIAPVVLIAEDDRSLRQLYRAALERAGAKVIECPDGPTALEQGALADVLLLDGELPGIGGADLARALRARGVGAPMLAVSGNTDAAMQAACLDAGCVAFILKPVSREALVEAVRACLVDQPAPAPATPEFEIDPIIQDLVPEFLSDRRADHERLQALLDEGDLDGIRRLGHSMKGSGTPYGFPGISRIGGELERAGRSEDVGPVPGLLSELGGLLDRACAQLGL